MACHTLPQNTMMAKKLTMLPVPIQMKILRLSLENNFAYSRKDHPEWKKEHSVNFFLPRAFIDIGHIMVAERVAPRVHGTIEETNTFWKFGPTNFHWPISRLRCISYHPCTRYTGTVGFQQQKTIPPDKMGVIYIHTRWKNSKPLPENYIKYIDSYIRTNSLGKANKGVFWENVEKASHECAMAGGSPFWYYRKCRCKNCDEVRKIGYDQIPEKEKMKVKILPDDTRVKLDLLNNSSFNGKSGIIRGFDTIKGRYTVELSNEKKIAVKMIHVEEIKTPY